jgi:hypothetical protein
MTDPKVDELSGTMDSPSVNRERIILTLSWLDFLVWMVLQLVLK